jgi:hypothetical protein
MPSTVGSLFAAAGVSRQGVVRWGERIPRAAAGPGTGVYVVALTDKPDVLEAAVETYPCSASAVQELLDVRRAELRVDGQHPDAAELAARLAGFWLADEVVLYGGRAGRRKRISVSELSDRVVEYYSTPLGARSPHAGGWPLKTLSNLGELYVHYGYCADDDAAETRMLDRFAEQLSDDARASLYDATFVMPFANLEDGHARRKRHGITGARAPKKVGEPQSTPTTAPGAGAAPPAPQASAVSAAANADVSAPELARRLGANAKTLRAWLRGQAQAGNPLVAGHEHYGRWWFTESGARQLAEQFRRSR